MQRRGRAGVGGRDGVAVQKRGGLSVLSIAGRARVGVGVGLDLGRLGQVGGRGDGGGVDGDGGSSLAAERRSRGPGVIVIRSSGLGHDRPHLRRTPESSRIQRGMKEWMPGG